MALEESTIALADPSPLHEQAYIDGECSDADSDRVESRYPSLGGIA
jgi:hypothetical protein